MDWWLASFFLGALLSLFLPIVPDFFVLFLLLLLSIIFFYYKPLRISSGLIFGAFWMLFSAFHFQSIWQHNTLNSDTLDKKVQQVQGEVLSLQALELNDTAQKKVEHDARIRFNLAVNHLNERKLNRPINIRLSWKNPPLSIKQGQSVKLKVKLKPAHGLANLGGFSYKTWLNSKKISATGYVINHKNNQVLVDSSSIRQQLFNEYADLLPAHKLSPLLLALGFGSRAQLNLPQHKHLWQVLQNTGTSHLIAISGLHIGLVATASYFIVMLLVGSIPLLLLSKNNSIQSINIRYLAIVTSLFSALIYAYLAGFSLPTLRALLMLGLYWLFRLAATKISIKRWLLLTLFLIVLMTPFSLFSASFWLSFYAVVIIFTSLWRFKHILQGDNQCWCFVKGLLVIQLTLTLLLWPVSALFFQQLSVVSLFANLVAVPWMSFISIPLCLISVLLSAVSASLSDIFIALCLESLQWLWQYLTFLSEQSWAVLTLSQWQIQLLLLLAACVIYLLFLFPRLITLQTLSKLFLGLLVVGAATWLLTAWHVADGDEQEWLSAGVVTPSNNNWQLIVFDVGQGLSVLLQKDQQAILYDTGAAYESGFNMVEAVVLPYLQHQGISQLDKVIISHNDNDHAGGLAKLQNTMPITELIFNSNPMLANKNGVSRQTCQQGKGFQWQNLYISMLWPKEVLGAENDDSCVLLVSDGKHKVLLTGDISQRVEAQLINQYPQLRADILLAPHHGSKTSSSQAFIGQVKSKLVIFSAGFLNRWHMPVPDIIERYQIENIDMLNTAESGQIIIHLSDQGISKQTYHDDLWPFWFAQ